MSRGGHRDQLGPEDLPESALLSSQKPHYEPRAGPWHVPRGSDYITPDVVTEESQAVPPARLPPKPAREPGRHRKQKPVRKIKARYISAAVVTAILAAPALWMASEIASENHGSPEVQITKTAFIPMTLYKGRNAERQICVYITNKGQTWKAWASDSGC